MSRCDHLTNEDQAAALISAVQEGHADCVKAVIKSFINVKDGNGDPVLLTATRQGNLKCMESLVRAGADVNLSGKYGITPLTSSAARGYINCVKFLIENGACVNSLNPGDEEFPLTQAAFNGQTETVKILLDAGADVNGKRLLGFSALTRASGAGHHETVKVLLEREAATDEALEWVADGGHDKCLNLLLEANYDNKECSAALHKATMKGYVEWADILIKAGADVNSRHFGNAFRNSGNSTALFEAVEGDHVQCVKKLIKAGADVNEDEHWHYSPSIFPNLLYNAAKNGSVECVGYLLDARPNTRTVASALVKLCEEGNDHALDILIQAGVDINVEKEDKNLTPIEAAAKHGHAKCVHLLLEAGVDVKPKEYRFYSRPVQFALHGGHFSCLSLFIEAGAFEHWTVALSTVAGKGHEDCLDLLLDKVDNPTDLGSALTHAAANGRLNCMKKLLDAGADINTPGGNEQTALIQAAERGQDKAVKFLLKEGAKVNSKDVHQKTALICAASEGFYKCVDLLIQAGADPNVVPNFGPTAIVAASQSLGRKTNESVDYDRSKCVELLICTGADVNTRDRDGKTALAFAVDFGRDDVLKSLVTAGADVHAADKQGNTPLFKAVEKFLEECTKLLISAGADVNAANNEGTAPLNIHYKTNVNLYGHQEAEAHNQCINLLLNTTDIDVNAVDKYGVTPLISAARNLHVYCLTSLLRAGADVNKTDDTGNSALNSGATWDTKCCDVLIGAGADVNLSNDDGRSPLMFAIAGDQSESAQKLLNSGADLHAKMKNGNTAVFFVVDNNCVSTAKWAYLRGISINMRNVDGQNLVDYHLAKKSFSEQSLMVVIAAGEFVDPNKRDVIVQKTQNSQYIPEALPSEEKLRSSLKQNCREAIRRHLLNINPHENLFVRVPKLQPPPPLERYLLYGLSASTLWY